ncbi:MAG: hypothetical protein R3321_00765 [Nitrososphaeraceae archaeon]|nr:hypothetical protein [Nitrososphaeraceae archaeon]
MNIASIFADKFQGKYMESNHVGMSAMTYEVLSGSKANGSDSHTNTAKAMILNDKGYEFIPGHGWCKEL